MEKKSYILYGSQSAIMRKLSRVQKGLLLEAIIAYQEDGSIIDFEGDLSVEIVFTALRIQFDMDSEKWEKKIDAQKENGKKGGRPRKDGAQNAQENDEEMRKSAQNEKPDETQEKPTSSSESDENQNNPRVFDETQKKPIEAKKGVDVDVDEDVSLKETILRTSREVRDTDFENFWNRYPKKIDKKRAETAWNNLTLTARRLALDALDAHIRHWEARGDKQFTPSPAKWINGKRWEDEIDPAPKTPAEVSQAAHNRERAERDRAEAEERTWQHKVETMGRYFATLPEREQEAIKSRVLVNQAISRLSPDNIGYAKVYTAILTNETAKIYADNTT